MVWLYIDKFFLNDGRYVHKLTFGSLGYLVFLVLVCSSFVWGQQQRIYHMTIGNSEQDEIHAIAPTSDKGWVVGGKMQTDSLTWNGYVTMLDSLGQVVWSIDFGGSEQTYVNDVISTYDGGYLVTGKTNSFGVRDYDAYMMKLDKNGNTLWTRTIGGKNWDEIYVAAQRPDSTFVGVGYSLNTLNLLRHGGADIYVVLMDRNGNLVKTHIHDGLNNTYPNDMQLTPDNKLIVTGGNGAFGDYDFLVTKLTLDGQVEWSKSYGSQYYGWGQAVTVTDDNKYLFAAHSNGYYNTRYNVIIFKTDSAGHLIWQKGFAGNDHDYVTDITTLPNGHILFGGRTLSYGPGNQDAYTFQLDPDGNALRGVAYGGGSEDMGFALSNNDYQILLAGATKSVSVQKKDGYLLQMTPSGYSGCSETNFLFDPFTLSMDTTPDLTDTTYTNLADSVTTPAFVIQSSTTTHNFLCYTDTTYAPIQAGFIDSISGRTVYFRDTSINASSWNWFFGDSNSSTDQHPVHQYAEDGTYNVYLVARNPLEMDIAYDTLTICAESQAHFTSNQMDSAVQFYKSSKYDTAWLWDFDDGTTSTKTDPEHIYQQSGTFQPCLYTYNTCGFDTFCQTVKVVLVDGIEDRSISNGVQLYPNPATTELWIQLQAEQHLRQLTVFNAKGQVVYRTGAIKHDQQQYRLNCAGLQSGLYFIRVQTDQGTFLRKWTLID